MVCGLRLAVPVRVPRGRRGVAPHRFQPALLRPSSPPCWPWGVRRARLRDRCGADAASGRAHDAVVLRPASPLDLPAEPVDGRIGPPEMRGKQERSATMTFAELCRPVYKAACAR